MARVLDRGEHVSPRREPHGSGEAREREQEDREQGRARGTLTRHAGEIADVFAGPLVMRERRERRRYTDDREPRRDQRHDERRAAGPPRVDERERQEPDLPDREPSDQPAKPHLDQGHRMTPDEGQAGEPADPVG